MRVYSDHYNVVVCGGGPSGIAAAVAAARMGAKTALVERYGIVGGMMTSGYVNPILGSVSQGTMYDEIIQLLGATGMKTRNGWEMSVDAEEAKYRLLRFVEEAGVDIFLQTPIVEVQKNDRSVTGIRIGTQEGLKTLYADVTVDATGDGFVAARAGASFQIGRDADGLCQPATLEFVVGPVDEEKAITCWGGTDPVRLPDGTPYVEFCAQANARGELPENVAVVRLHRTGWPGERSINATQVNGCNTLSPEGALDAELELRRQVESIVRFLRKYVPGYEESRLKGSGSTLGVRESRRIMGDYILQDADVENGNVQKDAIVHKAWFLIDIHNPKGSGQAEGHSHPAKPYDIPYRCLLPKGVEGMLTCGRCISGTHRAHASYRVMGICLATGQAAGVAAALAAQRGVTPRALPAEAVQKALTESGVKLFD